MLALVGKGPVRTVTLFCIQGVALFVFDQILSSSSVHGGAKDHCGA